MRLWRHDARDVRGTNVLDRAVAASARLHQQHPADYRAAVTFAAALGFLLAMCICGLVACLVWVL